MLKVVEDAAGREELAAGLDEIVREGARRMLAVALEAEVEAYLAAHAGERDEAGRRLVVRNGHARPRRVTTAAGAVEVRARPVDDRRVDAASGQRRRFRSAMLPPWCRRSPKVTEVLRCCTCTGCPAAISCRRWRSSLGRRPGCPRR